jgi:ABC-type glycerol-3-phosphate transport system substrate-binding protein
MKAIQERQGGTRCRAEWSQRVAQLFAALAVVVAVTPMSFAQPVEIAYNTFLDPNNATDPRAVAQTKMIAEFERQNPNIKVRGRGRSDRRQWRAYPAHACRFT